MRIHEKPLALAEAEGLEIHQRAGIRTTPNTGLFGKLQRPLTDWPDTELFNDNLIEAFRAAAGFETCGEALAVLGRERRLRVNSRTWTRGRSYA